MKELNAQVECDIRNELTHSVYSDTPHFIERIFESVDDRLVDDVFGHACGAGGIYAANRWTLFPSAALTANESALYRPFVDVANYITQRCRILRSNDDNEVRWMTDSRRHPTSGNNGHLNMADMKPDIVAKLVCSTFLNLRLVVKKAVRRGAVSSYHWKSRSALLNQRCYSSSSTSDRSYEKHWTADLCLGLCWRRTTSGCTWPIVPVSLGVPDLTCTRYAI